MPWERGQAVAILLKAKRSGDKSLERKAKASLGDGMGDRAVKAMKPRKRRPATERRPELKGRL